MNKNRVRKLNSGNFSKGAIVYWMSREQRARDNWALTYSDLVAKKNNEELIVIFCITNSFLDASLRHYMFMIKGLIEVEKYLEKKGIRFFVLTGNPTEKLINFLNNRKAGTLVSEFDPLRIKREWKNKIIKKIKIPFYEVDSRNIVPCWIASDKKEFGAYTLRPKINRKLPEFLEEFPKIKQRSKKVQNKNDWEKIINGLKVDKKVNEVNWINPGEKEAKKKLNDFIKNKLKKYPTHRNDPNQDVLSDLSPYLHFGQVSSQRIALEIMKSSAVKEAKDAFLEELIIRRELSDNYCYYAENYDNIKGLPDWSRKNIEEHRKDKREYIYSLEEFENGKTHDELWNAAQMEMVKKGKMHSYLRMYWAKKILEWSKNPEKAYEIAIYLNDKYELDGRDPNGYAGVAWSIGGLHDRAWPERKVFGKVRYMNFNGAKRKFDVDKYIDYVNNL